MGFGNDYPGRKDWRKPYYRAARVDRSCRPHGSCPWCATGRQHGRRLRAVAADQRLADAGYAPLTTRWKRARRMTL